MVRCGTELMCRIVCGRLCSEEVVRSSIIAYNYSSSSNDDEEELYLNTMKILFSGEEMEDEKSTRSTR